MAGITKEYEIAYAHRLLNHRGKCCRLHGHNAKISVTVEGPVIEDSLSPSNGMVMDFGLLDEGLGRWLNSTLDHRTILEETDPLIKAIKPLIGPDSLVILDKPPTAERLAIWIHSKVFQFYGSEISKATVTFWETSKACATIDECSDFLSIPQVMAEARNVAA